METILESLRDMSDEEAREYIALLFAGYERRKKEKRLFESSDIIPKLIILHYYSFVKKPGFKNIIETFKEKYIPIKNFKERYIYNENTLEEVHTAEEKRGLRLAYDFILNKEDLEDISIYTLSDIHMELYSKTPFPEFGGRYRNEPARLSNAKIETTPHYLIVREMNSLKDEVSELVKEGNELGKNVVPEKLLDYIDRCIELNCKLIQIHPFSDGNGRSIRAFTNLLFRLANIPPVYIENKERDKYQEAMKCALAEGDLSKIKNFYYYKLCDSIISLDVSLDKNNKKNYIEPRTPNKKGIK